MFFINIINDKIFLSWLVGFFGSQIVKFFIYKLFKLNKYIFESNGKKPKLWIMSSGGMPSSHTSGMIAMAMSLGFRFDVFQNTTQVISPIFILTLVMAFYYMCDAVTSRQLIGRNRQAIKRIESQLAQEELNSNDTEFNGHTISEILVGLVFGILVGLLINFL